MLGWSSISHRVAVIAVGCSTTQEKPSMMFEGDYRISNTITESNCMIPNLTKGASNSTTVTISLNSDILTWSQFFIGNINQGIQHSKFKDHQAQFIDMKTNFITSTLEWNATILFSDNGFTGTGDFKVHECKGIFTIAGTRIKWLVKKASTQLFLFSHLINPPIEHFLISVQLGFTLAVWAEYDLKSNDPKY